MNYTSFVTERNEALLSLDREKIERFAKKYGVTMPTSDEAFWRGVHKAICNITNIPFEVRQRSGCLMSARREKGKRQVAKRTYERVLWQWYQREPPKRHFIQHWKWKLNKPKREDV